MANSNKYNDAEPPKVKGAKKPKELKESVEDVYGKMITENAEGPQTWTDEDVGAMGSGSNAESVKNEEITVADESGLQAYLGKKKYGAKDFKALQKAGRDHNEKKKEEIKAKHSKADSKQ